MTPDSAAVGGSDGSSADLRTVSDSLRILLQAIRLHNVDVERQLGISLAQLYVLEQLEQHDGSSVNDLADRTRTHQSSVSVVVRKLVDRGLVERRVSASDGRRAELSLSSSGRALLHGAPSSIQSKLIQGLMQLGPDRVHRLAQDMSAWLEQCGLRAASPAMLMEDEPAPQDGAFHAGAASQLER